jgi:spore coat protein A, manganese oxidase
MHQIAGDAGLLPRPIRRAAIPLAPAERAEVLVDFCGCAPGSEIVLHNTAGEASTTAVMRFDIEGVEADRPPIPARLVPGVKLPQPAATRTFELDLATSPELEWQINGKGFDNERIDETPSLGTAETWRFVNRSEHPHPMHLHGCHFRVVSVNGDDPHQADRGLKDTVNVPPGQTVDVTPHFEKFAGRFVFHCHAAEHSDASMMGLMEIVA